MWSKSTVGATLTAMHDAPAAEDARALLREVERFSSAEIAPAVERHERPLARDTLDRVLERAEALGLGGSEVEPRAQAERAALRLGPWGETDGLVLVPGPTLRVWRTLSRTSTAVALVLHQRSLSRFALRAAGLGVALGGPSAIVAEGRFGLGRLAFARALGGASLDVQSGTFLEDAYDVSKPRVVTTEPMVQHFVLARFSHERGLGLAAYARDALAIAPRPRAHGLDELETCEVTAVGRPWWTDGLDPSGTRALATSVFAAHQLALVAISLGAVERAHSLATRYASERRQGGHAIHDHAAVLGLLGKSGSAVSAAGAQLDGFAGRRLDTLALFDAIALRSTAQPLLADAANAALQVFGGLGYMRETGLEKVVRDVNHLRACAGTPLELALVRGQWERAHD